MIEFFERFLECEREEGFFSREVGGFRYWHWIRFRVFNDLVLPHFLKTDSMNPDLDRAAPPPASAWARLRRKLSNAPSRLMDVTFRNPDFAVRKRPVLFCMTPRQCVVGDGRTASVLLDFMTDHLKSPYALLEMPTLSGFAKCPCRGRVFRLPRAKRRFAKCSGGVFSEGWAARRDESRLVAEALERRFGFPFESGRIHWVLDEAALFREVYRPLFRRWLDRLGVRVVVTAVHEDRWNMLAGEVAHELGIPVAELQHGTIYHEHLAYNLPVQSVWSPDYLLAWGDVWARQARNYPAKASIATGYPFLDFCVRSLPRRPRREADPLRVLFVSQGTVGAALSRMAVRLSSRLDPNRFKIVYKLHPNETRRWRELYPELASSGVGVVENTRRSVYGCLAECDVTVGVNSTSLVEGFAWGVEALVLRFMPGGETMAWCEGAGPVRFVGSERELEDALRELGAGRETPVKPVLEGGLWLPDAAARTARAIDGLARGEDVAALSAAVKNDIIT